MNTRIFHLAADGCNHQIVLELEITEKRGGASGNFQVANVQSFFSSKDEERIGSYIESICEASDIHTCDVKPFGWDFKMHIQPLLNLPAGTKAKYTHLTSYFAKRYCFHLQF